MTVSPIDELLSRAVPMQFHPFPTKTLPEPVRSLVVDGARAIGCDESFIALPALAVCAAAIGSTRRLRINSTFKVPSSLWCVVCAESGTGKSPAFRLAMAPMKAIQRELFSGADDAEQLHTSNVTIEALSDLLNRNRRGMLVAVDELNGWLKSFDRYAGRGGGDLPAWLSLYDGDGFVINRKTGPKKTLYVDETAVSICGGIQPAILRQSLTTENLTSGLVARLLIVNPPRQITQWSNASITESVLHDYEILVRNLCKLGFGPEIDTGTERPVHVDVSEGAMALWVEHFNRTGAEQQEHSGDVVTAYDKLKLYAARLVLVLHCVKQAAGQSVDPNAVDTETMREAIELTEWFKRETLRVYAMLSERDSDREQRKLVEWITRKGGRVTAREVRQGFRSLKAPRASEAALSDLVEAGVGKWEAPQSGSSGGRPTRKFVLSTCLLSTKLNKSRVSGGFVDVDSVDNVDAAPVPEAWEDV